MATDIKQFYEEHVRPLSKEEQMLLIAITAGEVVRPDFGAAESSKSELDNDDQELKDAAWRLYDRKLKALLEPEYNGKVVVVDLDSEDYEVAPRSLTAWKALKARHPEGNIVSIVIGPVNDYSALARRLSQTVPRKE